MHMAISSTKIILLVVILSVAMVTEVAPAWIGNIQGPKKDEIKGRWMESRGYHKRNDRADNIINGDEDNGLDIFVN